MRIDRRMLLAGFGLVAARFGFGTASAEAAETFPVTRTDAEWKKKLTPDQYQVLRREGTETPFSSELLHESRKGNFACAGCDQENFPSTTKFDSGTGWPSFWAPIEGRIGTTSDRSFGMTRTAVHCNRCGGHLGHLFNDGPKPTGLRYCLDGVALVFHPASA